MEAHADDLRSEISDDKLVEKIKEDWEDAPISEAEKAMLKFAVKLTCKPFECNSEDVAALQSAGWDDRSVSDIVQVTGYFNYINRIAEGLGVDLEPGMTPTVE